MEQLGGQALDGFVAVGNSAEHVRENVAVAVRRLRTQTGGPHADLRVGMPHRLEHAGARNERSLAERLKRFEAFGVAVRAQSLELRVDLVVFGAFRPEGVEIRRQTLRAGLQSEHRQFEIFRHGHSHAQAPQEEREKVEESGGRHTFILYPISLDICVRVIERVNNPIWMAKLPAPMLGLQTVRIDVQ